MRLAFVYKPRGAGGRPMFERGLTCLRHYTCQWGRNAEIFPHVFNLVGGKTAKAALKTYNFSSDLRSPAA